MPVAPLGFEEAERVFERMLWLNPSDNQGARFLMDEVQAKTAWEERQKKRCGDDHKKEEAEKDARMAARQHRVRETAR